MYLILSITALLISFLAYKINNKNVLDFTVCFRYNNSVLLWTFSSAGRAFA